jgi:hypothetical protein
MSTNRNKRQKLYFNSDIKFAQEDLKKLNRYFTRHTKKRTTVQVRLSEEWYKKLKAVAEAEDTMLSFTLDHICEHYFKHN